MSERTIRISEVTEQQTHPEEPLGMTVIDAVSQATGVPVTQMDVELNDYVDPDALDGLFADRFDGSPREGGRVVFSMLGCEIHVHGDGRVVVTPE
ncbi:hypothetical protein SAMN04487949_2036 [Halogranum gelatinilyticum]|uniref:Halobacterial output domain-containing protein n=1 Tax=Halogranum gelatinilyticum TaxID=660521 RepID=A0A1G9U4P1_9EURY|nr:HalOD1 output domain-containing protein [Halogranum gelatinilyticum]SDM54871.1 hypothetical protein SAMN04487949_2036 [Halogranum gelatinilyticum]